MWNGAANKYDSPTLQCRFVADLDPNDGTPNSRMKLEVYGQQITKPVYLFTISHYGDPNFTYSQNAYMPCFFKTTDGGATWVDQQW